MPISVNGANGITFADGSIQNTGAAGFGFKNRIINGDMRIDQRNAGANVTAGYGYSIDRWQVDSYGGQGGKINQQQNAGSVTPPVGFTNYLGLTSTSAFSVGAGDGLVLNQRIEGFNCADLGWGTANAKTVTLSFWVRSSLTGTFGGALVNQAGNRSYPFNYTISSANTWEYKTITIAGDTTGTWNTNNAGCIQVNFGLGVGTTYSGTAGTWAGAYYGSTTGATSVVGTRGATFYITGVQLEKGSTATAFDYRDYGRELALCQRYFSKIGGTTSTEPVGTGNIQDAANSAWVYVKFPTTMRAAPTLAYSQLQIVNNANYALTVSSIRGQYAGLDSANFGVNCSSNGTTFAAVQLQTSATAGYLSMSAEL